jgi:hypothetical protein
MLQVVSGHKPTQPLFRKSKSEFQMLFYGIDLSNSFRMKDEFPIALFEGG